MIFPFKLPLIGDVPLPLLSHTQRRLAYGTYMNGSNSTMVSSGSGGWKYGGGSELDTQRVFCRKAKSKPMVTPTLLAL